MVCRIRVLVWLRWCLWCFMSWVVMMEFVLVVVRCSGVGRGDLWGCCWGGLGFVFIELCLEGIYCILCCFEGLKFVLGMGRLWFFWRRVFYEIVFLFCWFFLFYFFVVIMGLWIIYLWVIFILIWIVIIIFYFFFR